METCTGVKAKHKGIIRLVVAIQVNRGYCIGFAFSGFYATIVMIIAHKHHGIIINGLTTWRASHPLKKSHTRTRTCDSIAHGSVNHLSIKSRNAILIAYTSTHVRNIGSSSHCISGRSRTSTTFSTILINHIPICVGQVDRLAPVWLYCDGCHSVGNVPVSTLVENTVAASRAIIVLGPGGAIGKIIGCGGEFTVCIGDIGSSGV